MIRNLIFVLSGLISLGLFAQKDTTNSNQYSIMMGGGFGTGFFGESFSGNYIMPTANIQLNENSNLRLGALTGTTSINYNTPLNSEDKAPYANRYNRRAAYMGGDFMLNQRTIVSVTAFFDIQMPMSNSMHNSLRTYGVNANLNYQISKNSFLNLSFTYIESNNPLSLYSHPFNSSPLLYNTSPIFSSPSLFHP